MTQLCIFISHRQLLSIPLGAPTSIRDAAQRTLQPYFLHHDKCRSKETTRKLISLQIMWQRHILELKFQSISVIPSLAGTRIVRRLFNIDHSARNVGYITVMGTDRWTQSHVQTGISFMKDSCSHGIFLDLHRCRKLLVTDPVFLCSLAR